MNKPVKVTISPTGDVTHEWEPGETNTTCCASNEKSLVKKLSQRGSQIENLTTEGCRMAEVPEVCPMENTK